MDGRPQATTSSLRVIVLAAGNSSRYGSPKLLVEVDGTSMLARAVRTAVEVAGREAVVVVLGAHAERLEPLLRDASATIAFNPHFGEGIASSIRAGVACVPAGTAAAMFVLADQVALEPADLRRLVASWERQPDCIVAARYGGTTGAPAIFPADLFGELASLQGDRGARTLLARHAARVVAVPMPAAAIDVDAPSDLGQGVSGRIRRISPTP